MPRIDPAAGFSKARDLLLITEPITQAERNQDQPDGKIEVTSHRDRSPGIGDIRRLARTSPNAVLDH
ncbi:hypothetical protein DESC_880031 [Desulfosarcina cetonica]|nr:hypothetical protein DESC_880031 [Desulfosarcina cetonica]